nr:ATPase subuint 8 [Euapta godeffroyi]
MPQLDLIWFLYNFLVSWSIISFFLFRCWNKENTDLFSGKGEEMEGFGSSSWENKVWEGVI